MKRLVADANVFLRYLLNDIPSQYNIVKQLFSEAKLNRIEIIVPQIVIFEILFSLDKYYHFPKSELIDKISSLISTQYFQIQDRTVFQKAMNIFEANSLSLVDCFLTVKAEFEDAQIFTFDKNFKKLKN